MGLRNGILIRIRKKHIRIGNKFDCVEGVSVGNSWSVFRVNPQTQSSNLRAWIRAWVCFEYQTSYWFDWDQEILSHSCWDKLKLDWRTDTTLIASLRSWHIFSKHCWRRPLTHPFGRKVGTYTSLLESKSSGRDEKLLQVRTLDVMTLSERSSSDMNEDISDFSVYVWDYGRARFGQTPSVVCIFHDNDGGAVNLLHYLHAAEFVQMETPITVCIWWDLKYNPVVGFHEPACRDKPRTVWHPQVKYRVP